MRRSGWTSSAATKAFAPLPKLIAGSVVPSARKRVMPERVTLLNRRKSPATKILPSICNFTASTVLSAPSRPFRNVASSAPVASNRARPRRVTPLTLVNEPPMSSRVSGWTTMELTPASIERLGLNVPSSVPSALRRSRFVRATPLKEVKSPPRRIFPSACTARAYTVPSTPAPGLKFKSTAPFVFSRTTPGRVMPLKVEKEPPARILSSP